MCKTPDDAIWQRMFLFLSGKTTTTVLKCHIKIFVCQVEKLPNRYNMKILLIPSISYGVRYESHPIRWARSFVFGI